MGLFLESLFYFIDLSISLPIPYYGSFVLSFKFTVWLLQLLFQNCLGILGLWPFYRNFRISFSLTTNSAVGIFIGIALNLKINMGKINIFTIVNLPIHEYGMSLHLLKSSLIIFNHGFIVFSIKIIYIFY